MTVEHIAAALELRRVGTAWRGACPRCGGTNRLQVRGGRNGALVWCFGGCSQADLIRALGDRGLWRESRTFTPAEKREWRQHQEQTRTAAYWALSARALAEETLESLAWNDPQRGAFSDLLAAIRAGGVRLLSTYRDWSAREPDFTRAMVRAGQDSERRNRALLAGYLQEMEVCRDAAA